jgi:hypothetical protein
MHRASGTFPAPYDLGFVLIVPYIFFVLKFTLKKKFKYLVMILLIILTSIVTQSKTALLLIVISTMLLLLMSILLKYSISSNKSRLRYFHNKIIMTFLMLILIVFILIMVNYNLLYEKFSYLFSGLELFLSGEDSGTLVTRLSQFHHIVDGVENNIFTFIFGNGINKSTVRYLESFYMMYQYRFGIIGSVFFMILYFALPIYYSFKAYKNTIYLNYDINVLFLSVFIWFAITPIACVGNSFMDIPRVNFIYFFLYGLSYYFSKRSNIEKFS